MIARRATESWAVVLSAMAGCALYAAWIGQDANWDLRNYHLYVVDAWLHGRTFTNLAPAQVQSWLNPLPHLLQVLLITFTPPLVAGMTMGALAGINGWLVWLLMRRLDGWDPDPAARGTALVAAAVSMTGPMFVSMIGASWAEWLCSPFVLLALVLLVPGTPDSGVSKRPTTWLLAGLAIGLACGLKLTHLTYALGCAAALALVAPRATLGRAGLAFAAGGAAGYLTTGGFWALTLWRAFGSPIFPYFNAIFRAPMSAPENWADGRFVLPSVLGPALRFPFLWAAGVHPTNELPFRDARFAVIAVLLPIAVSLMLHRAWTRRAASVRVARWSFVVLTFVASYLVWVWQFGIQRFALPLELLTGVMLALLLGVLLRRRVAAWTFVAVAVLLIAWTQPADWGRVPYGRDWFQVRVPPSTGPTLYVMVSMEPMGYLLPFMPRQDRFVRIGGNNPLRPDEYLGREAAARIQAYQGRIRTLTAAVIQDEDRARLALFGLTLASPERCDAITTRMDRFLVCDAIRQPASN